MKQKTPFQKQSSRRLFEATMKSLLRGMTVGFAVSFITALISWFTSLNGLWICLATFVIVTSAVTAFLYFKKYRPTIINSARRLDSMGLEERLVTMVEFQNDNSYIAQLQRADASAALSKIESKQIKISFSKRLIALFTVFCLLGCGMTTVAILAYKGIIPNGSELIEQIMPEQMQTFLEVTYIVEEGGEIIGEADQLVAYGENAEPVLAVADDGYEFIGWDDGEVNPARTDRGIVNHIVVMAIFELIEGEEGDDEAGDDKGDEDGEDDSGEPQQNGQSQKPEDQDPEEEKPNDNSQDGGGKYDDYNQIIDGKTYYREHLDAYKEDIEAFLKEYGEFLTEEEKAIILAYIGIV